MDETDFKFLFENMLEGYAFCEMIYDDAGEPVDFLYKKTNKAFEDITGLKDIEGKKISEVIPDFKQTNPEVFETYGKVAESGNPETFETEVKQLNLSLKISVYSPKKGYFTAVFEDITDRKKVLDEQAKKNKDLEQMNQAMIGRELKMVELKKEISDLQKKLEECKNKT